MALTTRRTKSSAVGLDALVAQCGQRFGLAGQIEKRLHLGGLGIRAHYFGPAPGPEHELECVDQDRLSCARFTGDDVEPGIELDFERFDDGEAPDAQARQHGDASSTGVAWALHKR